MTSHAEENHRSDRRQDDESRIAGNVSVDADEDDDEGYKGLGGTAKHFLHERCEETALFRTACADDAYQYHGERSKGGKIGDCFAPHHAEAVNREEIDDLDGLSRAGMDRLHTHGTQYGGERHRDERKDNKQGDRIGELIPDDLHPVQETVEQ